MNDHRPNQELGYDFDNAKRNNSPAASNARHPFIYFFILKNMCVKKKLESDFLIIYFLVNFHIRMHATCGWFWTQERKP